MNDLLKDLAEVVNDLLNPAMFTFVGTLLTSGWVLLKKIKKVMDKNTTLQFDRIDKQLETVQENNKQVIELINNAMDEKINGLTQRVDESTKEILRMQLLQGMDAHRLSESEVLFFYDKYTQLGGNSFVSKRVHDYIEQLDEHEKDGKI